MGPQVDECRRQSRTSAEYDYGSGVSAHWKANQGVSYRPSQLA